MLVSGGVDGSVLVWDVRRSAAAVGALDVDDLEGRAFTGGSSSNGGGSGGGSGGSSSQYTLSASTCTSAAGTQHHNMNMHSHLHGKAHSGAVNGLAWSDDGRWLVTAGHDERIRLWSAASGGANMLTNFGPSVRNRHLSAVLPLVAPIGVAGMVPGKELLFWPNEEHVAVYSLLEGTLVKRLRPGGEVLVDRERLEEKGKQEGRGGRGGTATGVRRRGGGGSGGGKSSWKSRTTALAWRAHSVELYSAHTDGRICAWMPRTSEDAMVDEEEDGERHGEGEGGKKRKRDVLDEIFDEMSGRRVTFS